MNLYNYLDHSKNTKIVFSTEAISITDADNQAKAAGFDLMKLACSIGIKLVLFKKCTSHYLSKEKVMQISSKDSEPVKYQRVFPEIWYRKDQSEFSGNSKLQIVEQHKRMIKQYVYGDLTLLWKTPDGTVYHARSEIKELLDNLQ